MKILSVHVLVHLLICTLLVVGHSALAGSEHEKMNFDNEPLILVMGDSLSAAYKLPEKEGWVALLEKRLHSEGFNYKIMNASVSGATTNAGIARLIPLLEQYKPKFVVLALGANDGLQGMPIARITQNLSYLIEKSQQAGAQVILVGIQLPPNFGARYTKPFYEQYLHLSERYTLPYLPFLLDGVAGKNEYMQSDGLHPNANAQPLVLENVWEVLKPVLSKSN